MSSASATYMHGFGNYFESESIPGALPLGRNSPQKPPHGLYAEVISGTAFTAPRDKNFRTWMYRKQPSVVNGQFHPLNHVELKTAGSPDQTDSPPTPPNPFRWKPIAIPSDPTDFITGLHTVAINGDAQAHIGVGIHVMVANTSMLHSAFMNADGEMLFVPQQGNITFITELGRLDVAPGEIAVMPRGIVFKVLLDGPTRAYVCENYGSPFALPELGPLGSHGLAAARDFLVPCAATEAASTPEIHYTMIRKFGGQLWRASQIQSPFNVVAWHGNLVPYKYDTKNFNVIGSVSFDHPDPSIFTVLTSASDTPGTANCDFVIFPPRWLVAEDTFRPPWFHRNVMSEFMGLVHGQYDAKQEGFVPGGMSLHNSMVPHGPDNDATIKATSAQLAPHKLDNTLAFMFESRYRFKVSKYAQDDHQPDAHYADCWAGIKSNSR
jgi:homogentisate 1,2-dioxygenase